MKRVLVYLILVAAIALLIFPFLWMLSSSFKTTAEIFEYPPRLIPQTFRFENYTNLFRGINVTTTVFPKWFLNSTVVTSSSIVLSLFFCSLAGFSFAKYDFRLRRALFLILLLSMAIPFHVILVPLYILVTNIGWANTLYALILPFSVSPFGVFLMRQYTLSLPDELLDAARMDGAGEFRIYWRIVLPLVKPALAALTVMVVLGSWNSFLWPLVILTDPARFTLPLGMSTLVGSHLFEEGQWGQIMAGSFLSTLPVLIVFVLMQKQFISGLVLGSVQK